MRLRVASSLSNSSDRGCRIRAGVARKTLREPVSVNSRTSLRPAEMEIGKWRAETGARNPRPKDGNARNCRPETGARQPNPREYQRFLQTRKNQPGDRTAWLTRQSAANQSRSGSSLLNRKMQGDFEKMQRGANCNFSMACIAYPYLRSRETVIALAGIFRG